ncbi:MULTISPECIES: acyl-CoA dehydrogenase family protein [unclassified Bradyrhizobium]|uniref:acyl-CoA dehydrogenase family protein n=1 Tax=Bradyrhizobium TaxID=374 RepID=UPI00040CD0A0|nr:acyl-CoA dehydrogenase family protein [Bradyrhizobium sp. WSM2254]
MILTETQAAIRDEVRKFAQARVAPFARDYEQAKEYPARLFEELASLGLMGMTAPEAAGGAGADYVSYALSLVEIAAADGALSTILSIQNSLVVSGLLKDGTPEQQARFLPSLISGRMIGAFALTEAGAGSDASALRTRAVRVGHGYNLNGAKQFISSGRTAGLAIVFAVTDPAAGKRGISAFLVRTDSPGYSVERIERKLGQAASDTCAIRFDNVFVEDAMRLGPEGAGYSIALSNLEAGRIGIAAQCVGMARAALDAAVKYAGERTSFGSPIIAHQAVGFRLADLAARLEAAHQLVLHAAAMKDAALPCLKEASMAKLVASETAEAVVSGSLQTFGGYGYLEDYSIAKIYRDVRVCQIYEGTSDIQRMVIARDLARAAAARD